MVFWPLVMGIKTKTSLGIMLVYNASPHLGGGRPLQYIHESDSYAGGNENFFVDGYYLLSLYVKYGTDNSDNLDNSFLPFGLIMLNKIKTGP